MGTHPTNASAMNDEPLETPSAVPELPVQQPIEVSASAPSRTHRLVVALFVVLALVGGSGAVALPLIAKKNFQKAVTGADARQQQQMDLLVAQSTELNGMHSQYEVLTDTSKPYDLRLQAVNTIRSTFQDAVQKDTQIQKFASDNTAFAPNWQIGTYKKATQQFKSALIAYNEALTESFKLDIDGASALGAYLELTIDMDQADSSANANDTQSLITAAEPLKKYSDTSFKLTGEDSLKKLVPGMDTTLQQGKQAFAHIYAYSQAVNTGDYTTASSLIGNITTEMSRAKRGLAADISQYFQTPAAAYDKQRDALDAYITSLRSVNAVFNQENEEVGYVQASIESYNATTGEYPVFVSFDSLKSHLALKYGSKDFIRYASADGSGYTLQYKATDGTWKEIGNSDIETEVPSSNGYSPQLQ